MLPVQPQIIPEPFCSEGDKASIPVEQQEFARASLKLGFPPETKEPKIAGGKPPNYFDFNGILNLLSQFSYWSQSGGIPKWSDLLSYVAPAFVAGSNDSIYICIQNNGVDVIGVGPKDPVDPNNANYWLRFGSESGDYIGKIDVCGFLPNALPFGWYFMNGTRYALTSPQGITLKSLPDSFKNSWRIIETNIAGVDTINVPNIFAADGTGATFTPANQTALTTGQLQEDMGRNVTGVVGNAQVANLQGGSGAFQTYGTGSAGLQSGLSAQAIFNIDASRNWTAAHTGTRFKVYGVGVTPVIYLGV